MDDIGASTKLYEYYTENRFLNFGPLRDRRIFGAWGPYREMHVEEWESIFFLLQKFKAKLTVAVTAAWAEPGGSLIPFPEKFPEEAQVLKKGLALGIIEIACHGLSHCIIENDLFVPKLWGSNRKFHREFWDWVPATNHFENLEKAMEILQNYFQQKIICFVPPGNVYSLDTVSACKKQGIKVLNCNNPKIIDEENILKVVGNENVFAFHDREIVLYGVKWLEEKMKELSPHPEFKFVSEL